ncbi:hypothetical protein GCM10027517_26090 [Phycicoccus ginsengisoli]
MSDYLESERLVLRQFTAQDADLLIELDSDPAVMRLLTGGEPSMSADVVHTPGSHGPPRSPSVPRAQSGAFDPVTRRSVGCTLSPWVPRHFRFLRLPRSCWTRWDMP